MKRIAIAAVTVVVAASIASPVLAEGSVLHIIAPCAPIEVLTGTRIGGLQGSSPVFVNGKRVGDLALCDVISVPLTAGKHNARVKLAGQSDYGISSDAGMAVSLGRGPTYLVMHSNNFTGASVVDAEKGRQFLSDVRQVK